MDYTLYDMHCHLDFMSNAREVAREAEHKGLFIWANAVMPRRYRDTWEELADAPNVRLGAGLHPWWIADGRATSDDVETALDMIAATRFVGEVGLDFSPAHADPASYDLQTQVFDRIASTCAKTSRPDSPKVLSIHAVRSASTVLDILERTGCLRSCHCIFHWFSGTSDELHRAVRSGCWFSINEMMLRTRRGREYARQVPQNRLLLETDLPPEEDAPFEAREIEASLMRAAEGIARVRGCSSADIKLLTCANSKTLLG